MSSLVNEAASQRGLGPVTTPTLVETVAEAIRDAIFAGRFAPGERLVEAELARELHVSRGPIREALALLTKDGIVVTVSRRGKFVQGFTPRLIDELYSLRRLLEPHAAALVIAKLDLEGERQLEAAVGELVAAVAADDEQLVARRDVAFHDLLFELAGHELLQRAWLENIAGKLRILLNVTTATLSALADAERQHRLLLDPILARDAQTARMRLEAHIDEARERARRALAFEPAPVHSQLLTGSTPGL